MSSLGGVCKRKGEFLAKVDTVDAGTRYYIVGPPRGDDEQQAYQDLCYIRAAAEGAPSRVEGLCAMQTAAKLLRDEAKALARTYRAGRFGEILCALPICRRWHNQ